MAPAEGGGPGAFMASQEETADFERGRQERIQANRRRMQELAVHSAVEQLAVASQPSQPSPAGPPRQRRVREPQSDTKVELRRSARECKATTSYKEEDWFPDLPRLDGTHSGPRGPRRVVCEEDVEELRRVHGSQDAPVDASARRGRGGVDSGKGVRLQGGRVYDSKFGVTCHWCRQKTLEEHVTCTNPGCGGGRRLATSFCKMCLRNRHGEDCIAAAASGQWQCPQCRGSCGRGCVACCNCGPCRKKLNLDPTHQVVKMAKEAGFTNVHDYLVHLVTGEAQAEIAARKHQFAWGKWLAAPQGAGGSDDGSGGGEAAEEEEVEEEGSEERGDALVVVTADEPQQSTPPAAKAGGKRRAKAAASPVSAGQDGKRRKAAATGQGSEEADGGSSPEASPSTHAPTPSVAAAPPPSILDDAALQGFTLTRKQKKQLEMGLVRLEDLVGALRASQAAGAAAAAAPAVPVA